MEKTKLNIAATLKQAFSLYRQNFGTMLKFALVSFLCGLPSTVADCLKWFEDERIARAREALYAPGVMDAMDVTERLEATEVLFRSTGLTILCLALMALSLVLWLNVEMKNTLGAQFYLADRMAAGEGEKPTMKSAYAKTKGRVADVFFMGAPLGLIACVCAAPFVFLFFSLAERSEIGLSLLKLLIMLTITLVSLLCYPWFFLIYPVAAFEEEKDRRLSVISRMIKGNFMRIIVVSFFGIGISTLSGSIARLLPLHVLAAAGIEAVITLFLSGFGSAAALVTYQRLKPKPEPEEAIANEELMIEEDKIYI